MRPERPNRPRSAFTLVELLVVMVILAIAAAVIVPYATDTDGLQAMAAARRMTSDLEYAQNAAITAQSPVTVTFSAQNDAYWLSNASGPLIHPINKSDFRVDFGAGGSFETVDVFSANFDGTEAVTFDELGTPDHSGWVILMAGPHLYRIEVAPATGRLTVTETGP